MILQVSNITKRFPGVKALDGVNFSIQRGEIHALMGQNGAGKSTLIKVLTGVHTRDSGEITFDGKPFAPRSSGDAQTLGMNAVYQEINLIPYLSVAENIFIGRQPKKFGKIDWKTIHKRAAEIMRSLELDIDVEKSLGFYPVAVQQMVSIARALNISCKLLIMDEPTSSLDEQESEKLFKTIRKLNAKGVSILFITHFLDQVFKISHRITVLRNGKQVGVFDTNKISKIELIGHMLGKDPEALAKVERKDVTKEFEPKKR